MAAYYTDNTFIFHNGHLVKAKDARIDLYSQTLHYGYGVFEGIRSYKTMHGTTAIFKPEEHFDRLRKSAQALNLPYEWSNTELIEATYAVLRINDLQDAYIRPLVYGPANMSFNPNTESHITIQAWAMQPFLGDKLLRVHLSEFQRPNPRAFHLHAKACGHYVNSILASQDAKAKGYDEALLKDMEGNIAEGPGANFFMEKNGQLITPAPGHILTGITRATVLQLCAMLHIKVEERPIHPDELLTADSAFFCGTAAEIIGIQQINHTTLPMNWAESLGAQIQQAYKALVIQQPISATAV